MIDAGATRITVVVLMLVASACAALPGRARKPWDFYANEGPLAVRGASRTSPGRAVYRQLRAEPELARTLARARVPDTLEVTKSPFDGTTILLRYDRGRAAPRVVRIDSVRGRFVVRSPELLPAAPRLAAGGERRPKTRAPRTLAPPPVTSEQELACPIDPKRADCRALCAPGVRHEWCD